jgi:hypothetical protein
VVGTAGIEGRLRIGVHWDGERILAIDLTSARPVEACRILEGRSAMQALELVPRLFSLCGRAQAAAAALALAATGAMPAPDAVALDRRVAVESVLEYLWRLLHDLPTALGEPPRIDALVPVRRDLLAALADEAPTTAFPEAVAGLRRLLVVDVLGPDDGPGDGVDDYQRWLAAAATPVASWLAALDDHGFGDWGHGATPLMPARPGEEALQQLAGRLGNEPGFAQRPDWLGRPVETGALATRQEEPLVRQLRQVRGHSCATRFAARLADLRGLVDGLTQAEARPLAGSLQLDDGAGLGWVQTARGLLLHRVTCAASDEISSYQVLAPTEWNFHPGGALVGGLEAQPAVNENDLRRGVALAVLALDPCVGYEVVVETTPTASARA